MRSIIITPVLQNNNKRTGQLESRGTEPEEAECGSVGLRGLCPEGLPGPGGVRGACDWCSEEGGIL